MRGWARNGRPRGGAEDAQGHLNERLLGRMVDPRFVSQSHKVETPTHKTFYNYSSSHDYFHSIPRFMTCTIFFRVQL